MNQINKILKKNSADPSEENVTIFNEIKEKLDVLTDLKTSGIIIRSQAKCREEGEKSTKYFLYIRKKKLQK